MFSDGNFSYGIEPLGTGAVSNFRRRHEKMWKDNAFIFFLSLLFIYLFKQATCNRLSFSRGLWIMFGSCQVSLSHSISALHNLPSVLLYLWVSEWKVLNIHTIHHHGNISSVWKEADYLLEAGERRKSWQKESLALYKYSDFDLKRVAFKINGDSTEWLMWVG